MANWITRFVFLGIIAISIRSALILSPASSALAIGILFLLAAIVTMHSLAIHENDPPKMQKVLQCQTTDGKFNSFRWDPSIQEKRWFTEDDLVEWKDPKSGEVHYLWPDEVPER